MYYRNIKEAEKNNSPESSAAIQPFQAVLDDPAVVPSADRWYCRTLFGFRSEHRVDLVKVWFLPAYPFLLHAYPICNSIADHTIMIVQKHEVYNPCVDAHSRRNHSLFLAGFQPVNDVSPQIFCILAVMSILVDLLVVKTVYFLQLQLTIFRPSDNMPARGCTDINC